MNNLFLYGCNCNVSFLNSLSTIHFPISSLGWEYGQCSSRSKSPLPTFARNLHNESEDDIFLNFVGDFANIGINSCYRGTKIFKKKNGNSLILK